MAVHVEFRLVYGRSIQMGLYLVQLCFYFLNFFLKMEYSAKLATSIATEIEANKN